MQELWNNFLSPSQSIPHGHCYLWQPELIWLHGLSDLLIGLAYFAISLLLFYFVRQRQDVPFKGVFLLFAAFIISCGITHVLSIWTIWHPAYWLSGIAKALTALISCYTAIELIPVIPKALAMPSAKALEAANCALEREVAERKQAQVALLESERRFRALFNQSFQFIGLVQPDGVLVEANQTALDFGRLSAADVTDRPLWNCPWWHSASTKTKLQQAIQQAAQGETVRCEVDVQTDNATPSILDFSIKPIRDEQHQVVLLISEGRDVTKRKQAEAEIRTLNAELEDRVQRRTAQLEASNREKEELLQREQEARSQAEKVREESLLYAERLELALDAAQMGSWDWNLHTNQLFWNPQHEMILGYQPGKSEWSYSEWTDRVHPEDLQKTEEIIQTALTTHDDCSCEYRAVLPSGDIRWLRAYGRVYCDADHQPTRMVGVVSDITEQRQADAALRESEERFRATFEQAAVGIAHLELNGQWKRVNQKLCNIVGYTREELLRLKFQDITHPNDLETDLHYIEQLLAGNIQNFSLEKRYIHKDGSIVWAEITVSLLWEAPTIDTVARPKYFIGMVEEIGDRKQAELSLQKRAEELAWTNRQLRRTTALLKRRNEELDQFAYVVSHDLKAPLRAIANLSEWIEEDLADQLPEDNRHQMELLRGRVYRMEALIQGLLEYSRVGRMEISAETVNMNALLSELIDSLDPPDGFVIEVEEMPTLIAKRLLLRQVFANLISNAVKHHHQPKGWVKIGVEDQGEQYEFTVRDDGPGIPADYHQRIFGIFQTIPSSRSKESTGIGLSIVKKIIEAEGGSISLESQEGEGATFRFTWLKQNKIGEDS